MQRATGGVIGILGAGPAAMAAFELATVVTARHRATLSAHCPTLPGDAERIMGTSRRLRDPYSELNTLRHCAVLGEGKSISPDGLLPEIVERPDHPWFIGVQFHPELKSRPFAPHPLFASFIAAAVEQSRLV